MIRLSDAFVLARTKLRARRILLGVTILTTSLLFSVLYGVSFIVTGIEQSMQSYEQQTHDGSYLVLSNPKLPDNSELYAYPMNPTVKADLTRLHDEYVREQRQLSRDLGVPFDKDTIISPFRPFPIEDPLLPEEERIMANHESPVFTRYVQERTLSYAKSAKNTKDDLERIAKQYGATKTYQPEDALVIYDTTHYLPDGKEDLSYLLKGQPQYSGGHSINDIHRHSVRNSTYQLLDTELLQNWLLPGNDKRPREMSAIPVIITSDEAVALFGKALGIDKQPDQPEAQIAWMQTVREKINGHTYSSCFRNSADRQQIVEAMRTNADIIKHKNDRSFAAPKVTYNMPTEPCGSMTVKSDTRTALEKKVAQNQATLQKRLGLAQEPERQLLTFQIVGVMQAPSDPTKLQSVEDFASTLFSMQMNGGAFIPKQLYEALPDTVKHADILFGTTDERLVEYDIYRQKGITTQIVAFTSAADARAFINKEGCKDYSSQCKKLFHLSAYGSNYLLLDDMRSFVEKVLRVALPAALSIAAMVIFLTVTRIIIDSRRETAVYRAIGAKRIDIVSVYMLYSFMVAALTVILSLLIGLVVAVVVQYLYGSSFTHQAQVAYGLFDDVQTFSFIGFNVPLLLLYAASIIGISLLATLPPLIRNVRRSPITDMRDE